MACDLSPFKAIPFVTYKFLVDNDTVSISVRRVGCIRSSDCRYTVDGSNVAAAAYVDNGRVDGPLSHVLPNIIASYFRRVRRKSAPPVCPATAVVTAGSEGFGSAYAPKSRSNISPEANPRRHVHSTTTLPQRRLLRSALTVALLRLFSSHCRKLPLIVTLLLCLSLGFLSSLFSVAHCLAPASLMLRPYRVIQIRLLLLLLLF